MTAAVPPSRLLELAKTRCNIFGHTFNPEGLRLGNKILRQRLRGPALAAYYPRRGPQKADIDHEYRHILPFQKGGFTHRTVDEDEEYRLEAIATAKLRGKGAPKKKRTADTTKKGKKKR